MVGTKKNKMKLILLRHAKTEKVDKNQSDFERQLLPEGKKQCELLRSYFSQQKETVNNLYCSTAQRTRQTYMEIQSALNEHTMVYKDEFYLCDKRVFLKFLWELPHGNDLMIIGHNNGISDLAMYFLDEAILLPTSGLIILEFNVDKWNMTSKGLATCVDLYLPQVD